MTAPVVGAVRAASGAATSGGRRVSRQKMVANRRQAREESKRAKASTAPTPGKPVAPKVSGQPEIKEHTPKLPQVSVPQPVSSGAGFILGLLFWTWVALPFLNNGGISGVRAQLKAKFTNKAPDGSWLP